MWERNWLLVNFSLETKPMQITKLTFASDGRSGKKCGAKRNANRERPRKRRSASRMKNAERSANLSARRKRKSEPEERKLMNSVGLSVNANVKSNEPLTNSENGNAMRDTSDEGERKGSDTEAGIVTAVELGIEIATAIALQPTGLIVACLLGLEILNTTNHLLLMLPRLFQRLQSMRSHWKRLLCKCS
jgi:hypothetical protein